MKLTTTLAFALSAAALSACSPGGQDAAENADANANAAMIDDSVVSTDNMTDTLGNQMNQLNTTGNVSGTDNMTEGSTGNTAANTTNSY